MPRKRKYDYKLDYPETLFMKLPGDLKKEFEQILTKKERNEAFLKFIREFVEFHKK